MDSATIGLNAMTFVASGDINPCRFVKQDATGPKQAAQAGANEQIIGISQEWFKGAPTPSASTLAASAGLPVVVYTDGAVCLLELGGTVDEGGYIKSDANGKGVASATTGVTKQEQGAKALEAGVSGDKIRVFVKTASVFVALS